MNLRELKKAIAENKAIVWNDPDPIDGNDYTVQSVKFINEDIVRITYGANDQEHFSEAEVYLNELKLKENVL